MKTIDFFLSHNRAEKDWTRQLNAAVRRRGASTFFDEDSIGVGEDIVSSLGVALQNCRYVVLVMSTRSVESRWVELEWSTALYSDPAAQSRVLLPVLKEDCEIPFLLRRLRHLDARDLSVENVAEALISIGSQHSSIESPPVAAPAAISTGTPLRFGAPQYVVRGVDAEVDQAIDAGQAFLIYGPRRVGKTSLLYQVHAKSLLRGKPVVWLDLQGHIPISDKVSFIENIGVTIARDLGMSWSTSTQSPFSRLWHLMSECRARGKKPVILIDECDMLATAPGGELFGSVLRALLSDPALDGISCVAAVFRPPWIENSELSRGSPWWNIFQSKRMGYFTEAEVMNCCQSLGGDAPQYAKRLWELTGGHPLLIANAASLYFKAGNMGDFVAKALDPDGPLAEVAHLLIEHSLVAKTDILRLLRDRKRLPRTERELLWLSGLTTDPSQNPPVVQGLVFRDLVSRLLDDCT